MTSWTNRSALPTRTAVTAAVAALAATALVAPTAQAAPKPKDAVGLAIQQRVDQMVTDGAIGAIARVDTPTYWGRSRLAHRTRPRAQLSSGGQPDQADGRHGRV
jgi:hypothetical protein